MSNRVKGQSSHYTVQVLIVQKCIMSTVANTLEPYSLKWDWVSLAMSAVSRRPQQLEHGYQFWAKLLTRDFETISE